MLWPEGRGRPVQLAVIFAVIYSRTDYTWERCARISLDGPWRSLIATGKIKLRYD